MRRGTQGHVAAPRGPTRRGCDVLFIYIVIIWVIVHISIPYLEFKLTLLKVASYIPVNTLKFSPCGTKSHTIFECAGHVAE